MFGKFWKILEKSTRAAFLIEFYVCTQNFIQFGEKLTENSFVLIIHWIAFSKILLQTFLRQFFTELNEILCACIKCNKKSGSGGFSQKFQQFPKLEMIMLQIVQSKFSSYFSHHYAMEPLPRCFSNFSPTSPWKDPGF